MRESTIEQHFVNTVHTLSGEQRKIRFVGRDGAPDRLVMFPNGKHAWVELKALGLAAKFPSNAHERQQDREHKRLRNVRQTVVVLDSKEAVTEFLSQLAAP